MKTKTTDFQKLPPQKEPVSASISPSSLTPVNTKKTALESKPGLEKAAGITAQTIRTDNNLALVSAPPPESSCPFRELIFEWLDSVRANGRSPKTLTDYQDKLLKFWWWWTYHSGYAETLGRHPLCWGTSFIRTHF